MILNECILTLLFLGEAWLYLFSVIVNAVNLFMQVFFTIMYSDLEVQPRPRPLCNFLIYVLFSAITLIQLIYAINSICILFQKWYSSLAAPTISKFAKG